MRRGRRKRERRGRRKREREKENRETNKLRFFGTLLTEAEEEYVARQTGELPLVLGGVEGVWLCIYVCRESRYVPACLRLFGSLPRMA